MAGGAYDSRRIKGEIKEDPLLISAIYNNIGSFVVVLDPEGKIILYNKVCHEITGIPLKEARDSYYWELFCQKEEVELYKEYFHGLTVQDFPFEVETYHLDARARPRTILWRHSVLLGDSLIKLHVMTGTDVTLHREADEALLEMGERYRALIHASPVAVISLDPETKIKSWSSAAEQIFGWSEKEVVEKELRSVISDETGRMAGYLEEVFEKKTIDYIEITCPKKDGGQLYLDLSLAPLYNYSGEISGIVLVAKDISDRKQIEEDLRRQLQFQKMVSSISYRFVHLSLDRVDGVMDETFSLLGEFFVMDTIYLYWFSKESNVERFYQWSTEESRRIEDSSEILPLLKGLLEKRDSLYIPDVSSLSNNFPQKEEILSHGLASLLFLPMHREGLLNSFLGFTTTSSRREWTEKEISLGLVVLEIIFSAFNRLEFEEALRSSEEYNRSIVDLIPDSIVRYSRDGEHLDIISSSYDNLYLPKEELLGRRVSDILPQEEGTRLLESIQRAIGRGSLEITECLFTMQERSIWYEARMIPWGNEEVIGLIRDITAKKEAELKIQKYTNRLEVQSRELETLYNQLDEEFNKARKIHETALPRNLPEVEKIEIAAYYKPAQKMGGDLYYVKRIGHKLIIYLADVTGHGLDGAMLSLFVKNTISSFLSMASEEDVDLESIMAFLTKQYSKESFPQEYFLCIYLVLLDLDNGVLSYLGAGFQDYPLLSLGDGDFLELKNTGLPISSIIPWEQMNMKAKEITLDENSTLLMTTDGLTEQLLHKEIYSNRLKRVFQTCSSLPAEVIVQLINEDFMDFNEGLLQGDDDITFLILKLKDPSSKSYTLQLESRLSSLEELRREVLFILNDGQENGRLVMALHEITANAIEHGNGFHEEKRVNIEISLDRDYVFATVEDQGEGFSWRERMEESLDLTGESHRGRGLALTRLFAKKLFFNEKGNKAYVLLSLDP